MNHPVILAVERTQRSGGVALQRPDGDIDSVLIEGVDRRNDQLLPAIDRLLNSADISPSRIDCVGVSIGPGSFTGIRVAVVLAKMIAATSSARTIGIPSALVAAETCSQDPGVDPGTHVWVVSASKDDRCWLTRLERTDEGWSFLEPASLWHPRMQGPVAERQGILLADEFCPASLTEAASEAGWARFQSRLDPIACLHIAIDRFNHGDCVQPDALAPLYPREPEAVRLWKGRESSG